jgi:hypothetical protein
MFEAETVGRDGGDLARRAAGRADRGEPDAVQPAAQPCSTTIYTIWKETRSAKWTFVAALLPLALGFSVCFWPETL